MLTTNEKKIDVYNCKLLCPSQFDVGYITELIKHSMIFYLNITAVTGCFQFDADIASLLYAICSHCWSNSELSQRN